MNKRFFFFYKIPLLISVVMSLVIMALLPARLPIEVAVIIIASLISAFVLDFEYVIYASIIEPHKDFSKTLNGYIKHGDLNNAVSHIYYHKDEIEESSLNNALFQIVMGLLSIFVVTSTNSLFAKALVLGIFANSIYKLLEFYYKGEINKWFWTFKKTPDSAGVVWYTVCMIAVLSFCLYFI